MSSLIFLVARVVHILVAALWIGSTVFVSFMLVPAADASGPSGGQVMSSINRRGITLYMAILAGTTVVTGLSLLWRFTGGFSALAATHAGIVFAFGGGAGIIASIVGGGVVGRNAHKVVEVMGRAMTLAQGPARDALLGEAAAARRRMKVGSNIVIALQCTALVLMSIGHYV